MTTICAVVQVSGNYEIRQFTILFHRRLENDSVAVIVMHDRIACVTRRSDMLSLLSYRSKKEKTMNHTKYI